MNDSVNIPLESVLNTSEKLRSLAPSVRHLVGLLIRGDRANDLPIESVLRPIAEFLEFAPGLQPERPNDRVVHAREVEEYLCEDLAVKTNLLPCTVKVLQSLRYTRHELYKLEVDDVRRLGQALRAVRAFLDVQIPPPKALRPEMEDGHYGCCLA